MSTPEPNRAGQLAARVTALEELFTHVERTVQDLDEVIRQVQKRLDILERRQESLTRQVNLLAGLAAENQPLGEERPPDS